MLPGLLLQRIGIIITDTDSKKTQKEANPVSKIAGGKRLPAGAVETGDYGVRWPAGSRKKKGEIET